MPKTTYRIMFPDKPPLRTWWEFIRLHGEREEIENAVHEMSRVHSRWGGRTICQRLAPKGWTGGWKGKWDSKRPGRWIEPVHYVNGILMPGRGAGEDNPQN